MTRLGGLWDYWVSKDNGEAIRSFTILTKEAQGKAVTILNRMPVTINPRDYSQWLNNQHTDKQAIETLMQYQYDSDFEITCVSTEMNSPRFNNRRCIESLGTK